MAQIVTSLNRRNTGCSSNVQVPVAAIHRHGRWRSFEAVEYSTLEWVDWFNHRRLIEPIGNIPPAEAEERYYAMINASALASCPHHPA